MIMVYSHSGILLSIMRKQTSVTKNRNNKSQMFYVEPDKKVHIV